jgi:uncharacterized membrane protein YphA (DoxX/SURF4 family)
LLRWGDLFWYLILGYLLFNTVSMFNNYEPGGDNSRLKKITGFVLWGASVFIASSFILASVNKVEHINCMICLFTSSGYDARFVYAIIILEALGGLGILLHFKLKTGILAAGGLMLVMIGALYTHRHNDDPFSDAYPAVIQFITLSLLMVVYYFEKQVKLYASVNLL